MTKMMRSISLAVALAVSCGVDDSGIDDDGCVPGRILATCRVGTRIQGRLAGYERLYSCERIGVSDGVQTCSVYVAGQWSHCISGPVPRTGYDDERGVWTSCSPFYEPERTICQDKTQ